MTKRLTHDEAREILLNGGKVDGYRLDSDSDCYNPLRFDNDCLSLLDCEGYWRSLNYFAYFTEHKEPKTFEFWVNVYPKGMGYSTKESANRMATSDRIACIKIYGKEGDGLD